MCNLFLRFFVALVLIFCVLSTWSTTFASAFRFDLAAKAVRCFQEEVPNDMDVTVIFSSSSGYAQFLDVSLSYSADSASGDDPKVFLWQEKSLSKGKFRQRIVNGGTVELCFTSRMASGVSVVDNAARSITLDFFVGANPLDLEKVATRQKLRPMEYQLLQMEEALQGITSQYEYYKSKEKEMRSRNETLSAKIRWSAVAVIVIIATVSYLQARYLERFLRKKRMID